MPVRLGGKGWFRFAKTVASEYIKLEDFSLNVFEGWLGRGAGFCDIERSSKGWFWKLLWPGGIPPRNDPEFPPPFDGLMFPCAVLAWPTAVRAAICFACAASSSAVSKGKVEEEPDESSFWELCWWLFRYSTSLSIKIRSKTYSMRPASNSLEEIGLCYSLKEMYINKLSAVKNLFVRSIEFTHIGTILFWYF